MISKDKALKLIKIYMYVCKQYDENLKYYCQRYSNNSIPVFTDQEILTIYLFVGCEQRYTRLKEIHKFAKEYLLDWFPGLISYQTFVYRLNRMVGAITELLKQLTSSYKPDGCDEDTLIVDSMPIMTCMGRNRIGKVAPEIADKGYCSTKNQYYYGMKLHLVGMRVKGHIPFPYQLVLSPASENDLTVFKRECVPSLAGKTIFADKIYRDNGFWSEERSKKSNELLTPVKAIKGASEEEKQRNKAADDIYSAAVSSVREPVEAFFSWLNEKTNIQRANKCRSTAGLLIHTLGKLAIAFIVLIFNY
ncbi:MAG: transposase [Candidatus Cryptobacteroides sp.]